MSSLINVVKSNPMHRNVVAKVFENQGIKELNFGWEHLFGMSVESFETKLNFLLDILKVFGHLIETIKIDYFFFKAVNLERLNQVLNESNLTSLINIELGNCKEDTFKSLPEAFKRAEFVSLKGIVNSDDINLKELCPVVRSLYINELRAVSPANIEHHFPNLELVHFESELTTDSSSFIRRLQLNPQLRSLIIDTYNWQGLKRISELLPNLEKLTARYFRGEEQFGGDDIDFPNLKYFHLMHVPESVARIPIMCTTLEELYMDHVDRWFDVVAQNKNLWKIVTCLNDEQLEIFNRIAKDLPKLKHFGNKYY